MTVIDLSKPRKVVTNKIDKIEEAIFNAKLRGYKINNFKIVASLAIAMGFAFTTAYPAYAASNIEQRIWNAFQPLISVMRGIGKPIVYLVETAGVLTMFFDKRKGIKIMKNGAIAYLVLQFLPIFLSLLTDVGSAIEHGN